MRLNPLSESDGSWNHSQLFTLRIWHEPLDAEHSEVRMQVRHVLTGETRFFRDWAALTDYLLHKLETPPDAA